MGVVTTAKSAKTVGAELIGTAPPGWGNLRWANSLPLRMESLEGKVALIRWFTDTCNHCAQTAPALRKLHQEFSSNGLVVIGMYHPKPQRDVSVAMLREIAEQFCFSFPIAADPVWDLLRAWWLNGKERDATSVSFVLDRAGAIRLVHSGPQFSLEPTEDGNNAVVEDFEAIHKKIRDLLKK